MALTDRDVCKLLLNICKYLIANWMPSVCLNFQLSECLDEDYIQLDAARHAVLLVLPSIGLRRDAFLVCSILHPSCLFGKLDLESQLQKFCNT